MGNRACQPARTRLPALLCLAALFLATGGHWAVLQSVAWTRMVIRFSASASLSTAIGSTLDGEHPCELCLRIRAGRASEESQAPITPTDPRTRSEAPLAFESEAVPGLAVIRGAAVDPAFFVRSPSSIPRRRPPVPPPRA